MVIRSLSLQTCMILMWLLSPLLTLSLFAYGEGPADRGSLHNEKLSVRFAELLKVNSADSANKIVKEIWNIWINDSPVLEHRQMLKDGIRLMSKQDYMAAEKIFSEMTGRCCACVARPLSVYIFFKTVIWRQYIFGLYEIFIRCASVLV